MGDLQRSITTQRSVEGLVGDEGVFGYRHAITAFVRQVAPPPSPPRTSIDILDFGPHDGYRREEIRKVVHLRVSAREGGSDASAVAAVDDFERGQYRLVIGVVDARDEVGLVRQLLEPRRRGLQGLHERLFAHVPSSFLAALLDALSKRFARRRFCTAGSASE
jgi:hypothetical protein